MIGLDGRARRLGIHEPISTAFDIFGTDILDYKIISNERNPFARMVSEYLWSSFSSSYLEGTLDSKKQHMALLLEDCDAFQKFFLEVGITINDGYDLYSLTGCNVADFIVRQEHFTDDLQALAVLLDADGKLNPETRLKAMTRPEQSRDNTKIARLFDGIEDMVRMRYARTFAAMGYGGVGTDCPEFVPWRNRQDVKRQYVKRFEDSRLASSWRRTFRMKHPGAFALAAAIRQSVSR